MTATNRSIASIPGLSLLLLAATGCSGSGSMDAGGSSTAFQFGVQDAVPIAVTVVKNGAPLVGAVVTVAEVFDGDLLADDSAAQAQGAVFFQGGTDDLGLCEGLAVVPKRIDLLDVTVQYPGAKGPYTNEQLREYWGPFAPSSRITISRQTLASYTITLEDG
jgi:hypothetical protein